MAVIIGTIWSARAVRSRQSEMSALAMRLGFTFNPNKDESFAMGWGFLKQLAKGSERYAFNVMRGEFQGQSMFIFDYHYRTGSGDSDKGHHRRTILMLIVREVFPQITIAPETLLTRMGQALGIEDINFESAEFSRAFSVRSEDKRFAYDICNPQMIEYLLANRDLQIEIQGPVIMLAFDSQLPAWKIESNLQRLLEIRLRLPDYLFTKV